MLRHFRKYIPRELKKESGKVFYSGQAAFSGPRPLYILGLNPGGDPSAYPTETVEKHTRQVLNPKNSENWSAYRDERWDGRPPGQERMQLRILHLLWRLHLDPGEVPASNLFFVRSRRGEDISSERKKQLAACCWPFHQEVIAQLKPQVILCLGEEAEAVVRRKTGAQKQVDQFVENYNRRRWKSLCFTNDEGLKIIRVTHPSLADWRNPVADPSDLVKRALQA